MSLIDDFLTAWNLVHDSLINYGKACLFLDNKDLCHLNVIHYL